MVNSIFQSTRFSSWKKVTLYLLTSATMTAASTGEIFAVDEWGRPEISDYVAHSKRSKNFVYKKNDDNTYNLRNGKKSKWEKSYVNKSQLEEPENQIRSGGIDSMEIEALAIQPTIFYNMNLDSSISYQIQDPWLESEELSPEELAMDKELSLISCALMEEDKAHSFTLLQEISKKSQRE